MASFTTKPALLKCHAPPYPKRLGGCVSAIFACHKPTSQVFFRHSILTFYRQQAAHKQRNIPMPSLPQSQAQVNPSEVGRKKSNHAEFCFRISNEIQSRRAWIVQAAFKTITHWLSKSRGSSIMETLMLVFC
ncbi:unnamed protein product [Protopolystoma xenopodis]|uniref:Uncharacterized protein n=1 Tax=Protopolystoma xenopodis TaxID=117903 RepID=A0A3S5A710_9PLAT|nr:unnamed protein product [Protopolystoma xenopodis]